jgi:hypothetical protein
MFVWLIDFLGEPGGARTHDPVIKSHVLYQLSYGLVFGMSVPRDAGAGCGAVLWTEPPAGPGNRVPLGEVAGPYGNGPALARSKGRMGGFGASGRARGRMHPPRAPEGGAGAAYGARAPEKGRRAPIAAVVTEAPIGASTRVFARRAGTEPQ